MDIGEGQPRAIAFLIFPQQRDAAGVGGEVVDDVAEVEILRACPSGNSR